jgi:hypothetical protein
MKKNVLFAIVFVFTVNVTIFSQKAVNVPSNFVGTWWVDVSQQANFPNGLQALLSIEIKRDGTWIERFEIIAYNQTGINFLTERGLTNGSTEIVSSGYVTGATSVEIVLTEVGEAKVFDRLKIDGNDIIDTDRIRWTKDKAKVRRQ